MSEQDSTPALPVHTVKRFHTVCKRVFRADPAYFPQAEYRDETITFCTEACMDAFLADPERFYDAHSRPSAKRE